MFNLNEFDLSKKIVSFGDGPASFNSEMIQLNKKVVSLDPIYKYSTSDLKQRIEETKGIVIDQAKKNLDHFVWSKIKDIQQLERIRMSAMKRFLQDFEIGKKVGRYMYHELPKRTTFDDLTFDLGLSSHFLVLYSQLGLDFHISSLTEMLRICKEIRVFPTLNLDAKRSELLDDIIRHFETNYQVYIEKVDYEFQKNGNEMLVFTREKK